MVIRLGIILIQNYFCLKEDKKMLLNKLSKKTSLYFSTAFLDKILLRSTRSQLVILANFNDEIIKYNDIL